MHTQDNRQTQNKFIISIILTGLILLAEIIGGIWSGSLALLSDAAHVFSDIFALALSYFALRLAAKPPDDNHSFGWQRAEIIAALINGSTLLIISLGIWVEAAKRWQTPLEIKSGAMMVIAIVGLVVNIIVAFILGGHNHDHEHAHDQTHDHEAEQQTKNRKGRNLNVYSAYLHVLGDIISSVGVIIAAVLIRLTSAYWIDPLISIIIGAIILVSSYRLIRKSLHILFEGVPEGISLIELKETLSSIKHIETIHDLHVWSLGSSQMAMSAHVVLTKDGFLDQAPILEQIKTLLAEKWSIHHSTVQFEEVHCDDGHGGCN